VGEELLRDVDVDEPQEIGLGIEDDVEERRLETETDHHGHQRGHKHAPDVPAQNVEVVPEGQVN